MIPPKTFIVGTDGYLGGNFLKAYRRFYPDCQGSSRKGRFFIDLENPDISGIDIRAMGYSDVLIAAAVTNFKRCEDERQYSWRCNVDGTLRLAAQCSDQGLKVIFFSSESVFDGVEGGYSDNAPVNPLHEYAKQKAEVERRLPATGGGNYLIVRIGKTFGITAGDGTLIVDMFEKLSRNKSIRVLQNQIFNPTLVDDIIDAVIALQDAGVNGLFNVCAPEVWSRLDIAYAIADALNVNRNLIEPISFTDLNESFIRPQRTDMRCERLMNTLAIQFTPMAVCIEKVAAYCRQHL